MSQQVKMVVCDLDGTLLFDPKRITKRTKKTIRQLRKQGILFGICSGRSALALQQKVKTWGIENDVDFVLGFNGAMFWDPKTGVVESRLELKPEDIQPIMDACQGYQFAFGEYQGNDMIVTAINFLTKAMGGRNELGMKQVTPQELIRPALKFMAVGMPWTLNRWWKSDRKETLTSARVFRSGPFLFEFVNRDLSKLEGIKTVCQKYGVQLDEVVTFGNDNNDVEMITGTIGVAMSNANQAVKEVSSYITTSNFTDGVAKFIEANILNPNAKPLVAKNIPSSKS